LFLSLYLLYRDVLSKSKCNVFRKWYEIRMLFLDSVVSWDMGNGNESETEGKVGLALSEA
jgi:hypothetical protein